MCKFLSGVFTAVCRFKLSIRFYTLGVQFASYGSTYFPCIHLHRENWELESWMRRFASSSLQLAKTKFLYWFRHLIFGILIHILPTSRLYLNFSIFLPYPLNMSSLQSNYFWSSYSLFQGVQSSSKFHRNCASHPFDYLSRNIISLLKKVSQVPSL